MDGSAFDRIVKNLAGHAHRRETLRALAGGSLAVAAAHDAEQAGGKKKNKKKKERKFGQTCGGKKKCTKKQGPSSCQEFANPECRDVVLSGNRCCGLEGAKCDPTFGTPEGTFGNCSCCPQLFCGQQPNGELRCQVEDT